jgi:hypothetical protein
MSTAPSYDLGGAYSRAALGTPLSKLKQANKSDSFQ